MGLGFDKLFGKKCTTCKKRIKKGSPVSIIELDTLEGKHEVEVCVECSKFWNDSAEILQKQRFVKDEPI